MHVCQLRTRTDNAFELPILALRRLRVVVLSMMDHQALQARASATSQQLFVHNLELDVRAAALQVINDLVTKSDGKDKLLATVQVRQVVENRHPVWNVQPPYREQPWRQAVRLDAQFAADLAATAQSNRVEAVWHTQAYTRGRIGLRRVGMRTQLHQHMRSVVHLSLQTPTLRMCCCCSAHTPARRWPCSHAGLHDRALGPTSLRSCSTC
jgi:hypothetical protein